MRKFTHQRESRLISHEILIRSLRRIFPNQLINCIANYFLEVGGRQILVLSSRESQAECRKVSWIEDKIIDSSFSAISALVVASGQRASTSTVGGTLYVHRRRRWRRDVVRKVEGREKSAYVTKFAATRIREYSVYTSVVRADVCLRSWKFR